MSTPSRSQAPAYVDLVHTMGTVVSLDVRAAERPTNFAAAVEAAADRLHEIDRLFSTWQADSWASRLVRGEVPAGDCPPPLQDVVHLAQILAELTDGYFSPQWRRAGSPGAGPDPTGLVKGWAAQQVSDVLLAHGLPDHVVNAAGDLVISGAPTPGAADPQPWRVGISDPATIGALSGSVELAPGPHRWALATSGPAERGLHVVDPHTGAFPTTVASATALTRVDATHPDGGAWADACATALVAAGDRAPELLHRLAVRDVQGFLVHADGRVTDPDGLLHPL